MRIPEPQDLVQNDPHQPVYPDVIVKLSGQDGNIFNLIGICRREMRHQGVHPDDIDEMCKEVMDSQSYEEALSTLQTWVVCE